MILQSMPEYKPCYSCGVQLQEESKAEIRRIPHGFAQYGFTYHIGDCVYIRPSERDGLLEIAQITDVTGIPDLPVVSVQYFGRYDDLVPPQRLQKKKSAYLVLDEVSAYLCCPILALFVSFSL